MNKYMMMGLLLAATLSFAKPPIDMGTPYGRVFLQSSCEYSMIYSLLDTAQNDYGYYDGGCHEFDMSSEMSSIFDVFFDDGGSGVVNDYNALLSACRAPSSAECASAKAAFYSTAASARATFRSAKAVYQRAAALAVLSYRQTGGGCGNQRGEILEDVFGEAQNFRRCMNGGGAVIT